MKQSLTTEDQEALLAAVVRKIPSIRNPARLQEAMDLTLALVLDDPCDRRLKQRLVQRAHHLVDGTAGPDMDRTAQACIDLLRAAKEHRLPDDLRHVHPAHAAHPVSPPARYRGVLAAAAAAVAVLSLVVSAVLWRIDRPSATSNFAEANKFVARMLEAAGGTERSVHQLGGALRVQTVDGRPLVTAEDVPPGICAASGWKLVQRGVLTINGVTPSRVSPAIITELCYRDEGGATIGWTQKPAAD